MSDSRLFTVTLDVIRGYADCVLEYGPDRVWFLGSHLLDSFRQLVEAVTAVVNGQPAAEAEFDNEPVYYRWVVERTGVAVRCLIVEGCENSETDRLLFRVTVPMSDFAHTLLGAFADLRGRVDPPQYRRYLHGQTFPDESLDRLREAVERIAHQTPADDL